MSSHGAGDRIGDHDDTTVDTERVSEPAVLPDITLPGITLRKARSDLGISLEEISDKTGLSRRMLKILEADDYEELPGDVYTRGYLRRYAALVNLDVDAILEAFAQCRREDGENKSGEPVVAVLGAKYPRYGKPLVVFAALFVVLITGLIILL